MTPHRILRAALFVSVVVGSLLDLSGGVAAAAPNIVLIFIDDMGYSDIGPFGNTQVRTPHLDKFAAEGMKFTSFYATPVCSMSRACLMTGCYNVRVSIPGVLNPRSTEGLHPDEVTLGDLLKRKGYATACIGKWHLGYQPEFLPTSQGFDHYFGIPYSNDMGRNAKRPEQPALPLIRGEQTIETQPDQSQLTRRYTEEAVQFIREHKAQPFFVYLPHTMIHLPLAASEAFQGKSQMGLVGDAIEEIDWSVGKIMHELQDLKLDDNTLVIFTSDNGPAGRPVAGLRGRKGTVFEGGVREPCLMRWPGKIPAGTTCHEIAGNIDVLPTFAQIVGAETPKNRTIDGRDITPLMFDPKSGSVRDTHLYFAGVTFAAIRQGDWKLFLKAPPADGAPRLGNAAAKLAAAAAKPALYNLAQDLMEANDVAADHPEIVARLLAEAERREAEIKANQRPAGTAKKAS